MAAGASLQLLPHALVVAASAASQWLLAMAIAALGLRTSPGRIRAVGVGPFLALVVVTSALAAMVIVALLLMRG